LVKLGRNGWHEKVSQSKKTRNTNMAIKRASHLNQGHILETPMERAVNMTRRGGRGMVKSSKGV
jgi:hypothetical protein